MYPSCDLLMLKLKGRLHLPSPAPSNFIVVPMPMDLEPILSVNVNLMETETVRIDRPSNKALSICRKSSSTIASFTRSLQPPRCRTFCRISEPLRNVGWVTKRVNYWRTLYVSVSFIMVHSFND